jgi:hypothetical protein
VINSLTASGTLAVSDKVPVITGGNVRSATLQRILDSVYLLDQATVPYAGDEYIPVYQSGAAVRASVADVIEYLNQSVPTLSGWIQKWAVPDGDASATTIGEPFVFGGGSAQTAVTPTSTLPAGVNAATTAVANNRAYWGGNAQFRLVKQIRMAILVRIPDTTSISLQWGLSETAYGSITNVDTYGGTTDWIGFRYSTSAGDTNFMYTYGTGGSGSFVSTGVAVNTNVNLFEIRLRSNGRADFYVNGSRVGTNVAVTTDTATNLQPILGVTTLSANARNAQHFGVRIAQRFF